MGEQQAIASGRYVLSEVLGKGGTATVYRAYDTTFDMPCAIKVLSRELRVHKSLRERLHKEARAMIRLKHTNILRLYDIGVDEEGRDYVVMELAEGGTLGQRLRERGPLPPREALDYTLQILAALERAHAQGIIHRDVKPDNVLLDTDGVAMLADFGIAMLTEDTLRSTRTNVAMGSLAFMPPEQRVDARSVQLTADLYAVGGTLYNLLTDANPIDLFTADPTSPRWDRLPPDLVHFLRRATHLRPEERFASAREMAEALQALAARIPREAPPFFETLPSPSAATNPTFDSDASQERHVLPLLRDARPAGPSPNPTLAPNPLSDLPGVPPLPSPESRPPASGRLFTVLTTTSTVILAGLVFWFAAFGNPFAQTEPPPSSGIFTTPIPPPPPPEPIPEPVPEPIPEERPSPSSAPVRPPEVSRPTVATAPPPEVESSPSPAVRESGGAVGRWSGSVSGRELSVVLSGGATALEGRVTVSLGPNTSTTQMRGQATGSTVELREVGGPATLSLTLKDNGQRMSGQMSNGSATQPVSLKRME